MPVTERNLQQYIALVADWRLNRELQASSSAFLGGLTALIPAAWLRMFNDRELQQLIAGSEAGLDIQQLRHAVDLGGGYHVEHPVIQARRLPSRRSIVALKGDDVLVRLRSQFADTEGAGAQHLSALHTCRPSGASWKASPPRSRRSSSSLSRDARARRSSGSNSCTRAWPFTCAGMWATPPTRRRCQRPARAQVPFGMPLVVRLRALSLRLPDMSY